MKRFELFVLLAVFFAAPAAFGANPGEVVINEIAWGGSAASSSDEWIEFYNNTLAPVDLAGWKLVKNGTINTALSGTIPAQGFFLVEARETAVSDVTADLVPTPVMSFGNSGNDLEIKDATGNVIDSVPCLSGWYAGSNNVPKYTMERRNPDVRGDTSTNWGNNDGVTMNGQDSAATPGPVYGTPGQKNSIFGTFVSGPGIVHVQCLSATSIDVWFSATLDPTTAGTAVNYKLNAGALDINPTGAALDGTDATLVHLSGIDGIAVEALTTLTATGIKDTNGEIRATTSARFYAGVVSITFVRTDLNADFVPDLLASTPDAFFTVQGFVTSAGDFSNLEAVIQDAAAGLLIYDAIVVPTLKRGDEIRISGSLAQYGGRDEILTVKHAVLSQNNFLPVTVLTLATVLLDPEAHESMLIAVAQVTATAGSWPNSGDADITITDDAGVSALNMRIDANTNIPGSGNQPTYPIDLMGIGGQYTKAAPAADGYQILPRDLNDIGANGGLCKPADPPRDCYTGPAGTENTLPCKKGTQTCANGTWGPCAGEVTPQPDDTCDKVDNDCDATIDEHADTSADPNNCGECGKVCDLPGVDQHGCVASACTVVSCDAGLYDCNSDASDGCETTLGSDTHCTSCEDDCTLTFPHAGGTCKEGACTAGLCENGWGDCTADPGCETNITGSKFHCGGCDKPCLETEVCVDSKCVSGCADADSDGFADSGCGGNDCDDTNKQVFPGAPELCDSLDNDCNEKIDEIFADLGKPCDGPDPDSCKSGMFVCNPAKDGLLCEGDSGNTELCNNKDDDCDNQVDEDWPTLGDACDGDDPDQCKEGKLVCNTTAAGVVCEETVHREEVCNGADDDCDNQVDEEFGSYSCGAGVCAQTVEKCKNGQLQACKEKPPAEEKEVSCSDGLDNDCDGFTDAQDPDCGGTGDGGGCGCSVGAGPASTLLGLLGIGLIGLLRRRATGSTGRRQL